MTTRSFNVRTSLGLLLLGLLGACIMRLDVLEQEPVGGAECNVASDCGTDTACYKYSCIEGSCGDLNAAVGTPCEDNFGDTCNGAGRCLRSLGSGCAAAAECLTGFCADNVCCDSACDDECVGCAAPASVGLCTPVPRGEEAVSCDHGCDGKGECAGQQICAAKLETYGEALAVADDGTVVVVGVRKGQDGAIAIIQPGSCTVTEPDPIAGVSVLRAVDFMEATSQRPAFIIAAGDFFGAVEIAGKPLTPTGWSPPQPTNDMLVIKMDLAGNPVGVAQFGGTGGINESADALVVDGDVIHIAGRYRGDMYINGESLSNASTVNESLDGFVLTLNSDLEYVAFRRLGGYYAGTGPDPDDQVTDIRAVGGELMVAGYFSGAMTTGPNQTPVLFGAQLVSSGGRDAFAMKLSGDGQLNPLWAHRIGTANGDHANVVAARSDGSIVYAGATDVTGAAGVGRLFVTAVDVTTLEAPPLWQRSAGDPSAIAQVRDLAVDEVDGVLLAGRFSDALSFDCARLYGPAMPNGIGAFLWKMGAGGNCEWAAAIEGTTNGYANAVAFDGTEFVATGRYEGELMFAGGSHQSDGVNGFFIRFRP